MDDFLFSVTESFVDSDARLTLIENPTLRQPPIGLSRYRRMKDAWEASPTVVVVVVVVVGDLPTSCWIINLDWGPRLDDLNTHAGGRQFTHVRSELALRADLPLPGALIGHFFATVLCLCPLPLSSCPCFLF